MCGLKPDRVLEAMKVVASQQAQGRRVIPVVEDYRRGPVSIQVVRVVLSYVDYINRTVWGKL